MRPYWGQPLEGGTIPMSDRFVVLILALLLGLQAVTTDMYLPVMPAIREGLQASVGQVQLSLTALLLPFGVSQLLWGPLSDHWGRKPILIAGLSAYVLASLASAMAPSMPWLLAARAVQGMAMGAAVMAARAIVRDLYPPERGATVMSQALSGLGLLASISAPLGGWLSDGLGWRATLITLGGFGLCILGLLLGGFRETLARPRRGVLGLRSLLRSNLQILRHPVFRTWCALSTASFLAMFSFLATSSFVFTQQLGYSRTAYGFFLFSNSWVYILGTFLCRWLLRRTSVHRTVALAGILSLSAGLLIAGLAHWGADQAWYGAWAIMGPVYVFMLGHGIHQPCGQSGVVSPFPHQAGTASALNGFLMMLAAFGMGAWLAQTESPLLALADGMLFWCSTLALIAWTLVQKHGRPVLTPAQ